MNRAGEPTGHSDDGDRLQHSFWLGGHYIGLRKCSVPIATVYFGALALSEMVMKETKRISGSDCTFIASGESYASPSWV